MAAQNFPCQCEQIDFRLFNVFGCLMFSSLLLLSHKKIIYAKLHKKKCSTLMYSRASLHTQHIKRMGYSRKTPLHWLPLLSAKEKKLRLQRAQAYRNVIVETHESMEPLSYLPTGKEQKEGTFLSKPMPLTLHSLYQNTTNHT